MHSLVLPISSVNFCEGRADCAQGDCTPMSVPHILFLMPDSIGYKSNLTLFQERVGVRPGLGGIKKGLLSQNTSFEQGSSLHYYV